MDVNIAELQYAGAARTVIPNTNSNRCAGAFFTIWMIALT
jgi:hypothetical protein